jgi:hypothetical protein
VVPENTRRLVRGRHRAVRQTHLVTKTVTPGDVEGVESRKAIPADGRQLPTGTITIPSSRSTPRRKQRETSSPATLVLTVRRSRELRADRGHATSVS